MPRGQMQPAARSISTITVDDCGKTDKTPMIRWFSGEWLLKNRPNGGTAVVLRAMWVASLGYVSVILLSEAMRPDASWGFSSDSLRRAMLDKAGFFGAFFAASYTALYARFASQWAYLAGVYNQIMAAKVRGVPKDGAEKSALDAWQAGFIEDAEELHLATKPMFAGVILSMLDEENGAVRAKYIAGTAGASARLTSLETRVRRAFANAGHRHG